MPLVIHKFPLSLIPPTSVLSLGGTPRVLHVGYQPSPQVRPGGYREMIPTIWILHDPNSPLKPHTIGICPTGGELHDHTIHFLGTCQSPTDPLVWHLFSPTLTRA